MQILFSNRIKLIALDHHHLLLQKNSWVDLEKSLQLNPIVPVIEKEYSLELEDALDNFWLPNVAVHPTDYQWYTSWLIIHIKDNVVIGGIGFSGIPNDQQETMVGYHIDENYKSLGFATEALDMLVGWAFQNPNLQSIIATTFSHNIGSHRVLEKNGFKKEDVDELIHWRLERNSLQDD